MVVLIARHTSLLKNCVPWKDGESFRDDPKRLTGDMNVNVCRTKKLDNMRAAGKDDSPIITPALKPTIESALEWIEEDELLEVTPESLRLRKRLLARNMRKRTNS